MLNDVKGCSEKSKKKKKVIFLGSLLLASSAVSILRSEVLSYNKRNYFDYVQHYIVVDNVQ